MTLGILGIDPGLSGAVARIGFDGSLIVDDMPTLEINRNGKAKRDIDLNALAAPIEAHRPAFAVVEAVGAMPGQGTASMFAFGKGFGSILGILAAQHVRVELVTPVVWKRALGVPKGKDAARARASELLPAHGGYWRRAKDDGRAEAAMLAWHGLANLSGRFGLQLNTRGAESAPAHTLERKAA